MALRDATNQQDETINSIRFHEVLANLAMFERYHGDLPWATTFNDGVITVQDQLGAGYQFNAPNHGAFYDQPSVSTQRQWQESWTVNPVNFSLTLLLLRKIYTEQISRPCTPNSQSHRNRKARSKSIYQMEFSPAELRVPLFPRASGVSPPTSRAGLSTAQEIYTRLVRTVRLPKRGWFVCVKGCRAPSNAAYSATYGGVTVYVMRSKVHDLARLAIIILRAEELTKKDTATISGNQIRF